MFLHSWGQCYQNYICKLQSILVNRIFIALWIQKQIFFVSCFSQKIFFPQFVNYILISLGAGIFLDNVFYCSFQEEVEHLEADISQLRIEADNEEVDRLQAREPER